jgi:hypothetical protein
MIEVEVKALVSDVDDLKSRITYVISKCGYCR